TPVHNAFQHGGLVTSSPPLPPVDQRQNRRDLILKTDRDIIPGSVCVHRALQVLLGPRAEVTVDVWAILCPFRNADAHDVVPVVKGVEPVLKLSDNPPALSPTVRELCDLKGQWWVAYTMARQEKALAWDLLRRNIGYYLPMREQRSFSGGRNRRTLLPLFPSYVFFCGDENGRYAALTTNRISHIIEVVNQRQLVEELSAVQRALAVQPVVETCALPEVGRRCRVIDGPHKGLEGIVIEDRDKLRFVLRVEALNQGVAVGVDPTLLEPIG
ncbi:MAG: hypothetical protein FJ290_30890, partial [Planctomycetes bacterium]|nr:hypothetical protein [Planctomycetota bacterium]